METMDKKIVEIIIHEAPTLLLVDFDFAEHVRSIIVMRWNGMNTPLHTLAHYIQSFMMKTPSLKAMGSVRTHIRSRRWPIK